MADIGKLSVQVSASGKSIPADLKDAGDKLAAGADSLSGIARAKGHAAGRALSDGIRKAASFGSELFTNPAKMIGAAVGGVADFVAKIPAVGGLFALPLDAAAAGINAGLDIYEKNAGRIKELGKGAAKAGLDVADFQLLSKITGDVDGASRAWGKFNQRLAEAEMAGEGVRTAFDRFGMDGKEVAADFEADFRGALGRTFDRIAALPMSMQTLAARQLFGKQGVEMLPSIRKGAAGVAMQQDMLDKFGGGVNEGLVSSVKQAEKAKKQIAGLWEGFGNQVTVAVAPALAVISEEVGKLPGGFAGLGETIVNTVGRGALFVADVIDGWTNGDAADRMEPYWLEFKAFGSDAVDFIIDRFADGITSKVVPQWLKLAAAFGIAMNPLLIPKGADEKGESEAERWRKEAAEARERIAEAAPGAARASVQARLDDILGRMDAGKKAADFDPFGKLYDRINKLNDATKGPLGEFKDGMGDLVQLLKKVDEAAEMATGVKGVKDMLGAFAPGGLGDLARRADPFEAGAAEMDAYAKFQKLKAAMGGDERRLGGALEKGSAGAYSAIAAYEQHGRANVQEEIKQLLEAAQRQREEQIRVGRDVVAAVRAIPIRKAGF